MELRLVLVFAVVAALSALADGRPTHCDRWKGDSEYRCGKDDYGRDRVSIRNRSGGDVTFKVGKWLSQCGRPGVNYADESHSLGSGQGKEVDFNEAGPGTCNELFVYDCKVNGRGANCLDAVTVSPA